MSVYQEKQEIFLLKLIFHCHTAKERKILFKKGGEGWLAMEIKVPVWFNTKNLNLPCCSRLVLRFRS